MLQFVPVNQLSVPAFHVQTELAVSHAPLAAMTGAEPAMIRSAVGTVSREVRAKTALVAIPFPTGRLERRIHTALRSKTAARLGSLHGSPTRRLFCVGRLPVRMSTA